MNCLWSFVPSALLLQLGGGNIFVSSRPHAGLLLALPGVDLGPNELI